MRDNYQNLEFLGDSVLGFIVSRTLYSEYADTDEGSLTKMRAAVVSERPLAAAIDRLGVAEELITGESEKKNGVSDLRVSDCGDIPRRRARRGGKVRARCAFGGDRGCGGQR